MSLFRNLIMFLGGIVMMIFAFTFGAFIFAVLAVIGLIFWAYFKLQKKEIINSMEQMGMGQEPPSQTIDGDYEVVEAEFEVIEEKDPAKKD